MRLGCVALLVGACGPSRAAPQGERTDSAGVAIVTSPGSDRALPWRLEAERAYGGEADGPLSFYRVSAATVVAGDGALVYVLDTSHARVVAIDADAGYRWAVGRAGGGPGELLGAHSLTLDEAGVLHVHDTRKAALVRFDARDGRVLEQLPLTSGIFRAGLRHVEAVPGGLAVLMQEPFSGSDDRRVRLLRVLGADTILHFARALDLSRTAQYPACGMTLTLPVLFAPQVRWASHAERLAVVTDADYRIDVFDEGGMRASVRRRLEPQAVTRAAALETLAAAGEGGPLMACNVSAEDRLAKHGFATRLQIVQALVYDRDGRLWVRRRRDRTDVRGAIDIFAANGDYVGSLPAGTPFPLVFLADGRVVHAERDEHDVERLVIARLVTERDAIVP